MRTKTFKELSAMKDSKEVISKCFNINMLFQQRCIFNEISKSAFLLFTFVRDARVAREKWNFPQ